MTLIYIVYVSNKDKPICSFWYNLFAFKSAEGVFENPVQRTHSWNRVHATVKSTWTKTFAKMVVILEFFKQNY